MFRAFLFAMTFAAIAALSSDASAQHRHGGGGGHYHHQGGGGTRGFVTFGYGNPYGGWGGYYGRPVYGPGFYPAPVYRPVYPVYGGYGCGGYGGYPVYGSGLSFGIRF